MTEEQVFLAALDLPDAAARAAYLDEACGTDAGLRRQVEALLAAHFQSGEFLDVPAAEQIGTDSNLGDAVTIQSDAMAADRNHDDESDALEFLAPPTRPDSLGRIGHYEVLQVLGKGGFGIVFRAFDDVLQRVVAVKVLAPQLAATSPARKRFLREARASAAGPARERRAGLRGRGAAAAVPGDGVHPRRDAPAAARPDAARSTWPRCCGSAGRSPRGWPRPTPRT